MSEKVSYHFEMWIRENYPKAGENFTGFGKFGTYSHEYLQKAFDSGFDKGIERAELADAHHMGKLMNAAFEVLEILRNNKPTEAHNLLAKALYELPSHIKMRKARNS